MRIDTLHLANSKPEQVAISHHTKKITFSEMERKVQKFAGYFKTLGVCRGARWPCFVPTARTLYYLSGELTGLEVQ